jgi:hypothetical protein
MPSCSFKFTSAATFAMPPCFFKSELRPVWFQESLRNRGSDWSGNLGSRARCLVTIQGGDVSDLLTLDLIISAGRGGDSGFGYGIICATGGESSGLGYGMIYTSRGENSGSGYGDGIYVYGNGRRKNKARNMVGARTRQAIR